MAAIPFPHLDPVIFRLEPLAVRWYGLTYLLTFAAGFWMLRRMVDGAGCRWPKDRSLTWWAGSPLA